MELIKNLTLSAMIIDDNINNRKKIIKFFSADESVRICGCFSCNENIIFYIRKNLPDVVVVNVGTYSFKKINILSEINELPEKIRPKIIAISSSNSCATMSKLFGRRIDYFINEPIILSLLKDAIIAVCRDNTFEYSHEVSLIKKVVTSVGVPINVLGYSYTVLALDIMLRSQKTILAKDVYNTIAEFNNTSSDCVEAAVRNAIKKAQATNTKAFEHIFKYSRKPISNAVFLITLKEYILSGEFFIFGADVT